MLLADVRYALRRLWHSKGFAIVAVLCLGFGIGVNTTIFSIVDGVLLKPFPYADPDRLIAIGTAEDPNDGPCRISTSTIGAGRVPRSRRWPVSRDGA